MPRDLNSMRVEFSDGQVWEVGRSSPAIKARPYKWRDPETIPPRDWLYGRQLIRGSIGVIVAPGATGKTALTIGTALALATGRDLLGHRVWGGPKRCWLWNLEDSELELARSIQAAALHWGIEAGDLEDRLFVDSAMEGAGLCVAQDTKDGARINRPVIEALVAELGNRLIDVLVVDPFVSSHGVEENDNGAIDMVAKEWARVAARTGCAIVLVHHARKLAGAEVTAEAARGAVSLIAAARSVLTLNRMTEDEAARFGIEGEERRRFFRCFDDKNNRSAPAERSDWYRLASVSLGNRDDGGDSMGVVEPWTPPDAFDGVTAAHLLSVQNRISAGDYRKDHQAKPWAGEVVAEVLELDAEKHRGRICSILRTWEASGAIVVENVKNAATAYKPRPVYRVGNLAVAE